MEQERAPLGVLILHGFTSSLATVGQLAPRVERLGMPYRMPVLRGHGTRPEDLVGVHWRDWVVDADAALASLLEESERAAIVGLSMGGLVALVLGVDRADRVAGIVAVAPALRLASPLTPLAGLVARVRPWTNVPNAAFEDRELAKLSSNYTRAPTAAVVELVQLGRVAQERTAELRVPLLMLAARRDRVTSVAHTERVFTSAVSANKQLVWFERTGHEMLQDLERERVMDEIETFLLGLREAGRG